MWDSHECEGKLREIITKAVCARGKKQFVTTHSLHPDPTPDRVLGCWLANHQYEVKGFPNCAVVKGRCELNLWYAYKDNSKTEIYRETVTYTESIAYEENLGRIGKEEEIYIRENSDPKCLDVIVHDDQINIEVECDFSVEVIGETKLCVLAYPCELLDDSEPDKDDEDTEEDDSEFIGAEFDENDEELEEDLEDDLLDEEV